MDQQETQFDIFFQGSQDQLFSFLYPLTGPDNKIFQHLDLQGINFDTNNKKFQFIYQPLNFKNIDKQKQNIVYQSTSIPSQSNYFFSTMIPQQKSLVWRSINRFVELRPNKQKPKKQSKKQQNNIEQIIKEDDSKIQLTMIHKDDHNNKVHKKIYQAPTQNLQQIYDIGQQQYLTRLSR